MGEWQPIETAPKDGTCVLLYTGAGRIVVADYIMRRDGTAIWCVGMHGDRAVSSAQIATHWMPLPKPPQTEERKEEQ